MEFYTDKVMQYAGNYTDKVLHYSENSVLAATLATVFVSMLFLLLLFQGKKHRLPPGPRPVWPVVGNIPSLLVGHSLLHLNMHKLAAQYGGLMYLQLGSMPCIVLSTCEAAREVFQKRGSNFLSRPSSFACTIIMGSKECRTMAIAPYGPCWRQLRKLSSLELFSPRRHASFQDARSVEIHTMMKELLIDVKKGDAVDLTSWLHSVTANITTRMLMNKRFFGKGLDINQQEKMEFERVINRIYDEVSTFVISDFIPYLSFIPKLQGLPSLFENLRDEIDEILLSKIFGVEKHRQRAEQAKGDDSNNDYVPDFIDVLLTKPMDDGKPLSDREISLLLLETFLAGRGTSAATSEWALAELLLQPDLLKRAQEELNNVVGSDRLVQESDLPNLPFLNAIVKETFRVHPPTSIAPPRKSIEAAEVMGYEIPANTTVMLNLYSIHRDPSVYQDPSSFDPQRFIDHPEVNHLSGVDSYQLSPFGLGPRMCPGYNVGNLMVVVTLANLLHNFDWSVPKGESLDMSEVFAMTTCRSTPLRLTATLRSPASLYQV